MREPAALTREVLARCRERGFALAGVAPAAPSARADQIGAWLAAGKHGTMEYLDRDLEVRTDPARVLDGCRAFVVVGDVYAERGDQDAPGGEGPPRGRIARYARGRNYHEVMKRRLHGLADGLRVAHPGAEFRTCVDTAPILERELAVWAGLGWQAKNAMVIHPRAGSYFLIGVVATTLELTPTSAQDRAPDHCGTCTRCIDACPTGAITPYSVDASRCVSYLTIERREMVPREFFEGIGDWVFGCDICQEVCPHNSERARSEREGVSELEPHAAYAPRRDGFDLLEVLGWTAADREEAFRSSAMKRASLAMMKRNALIAAGNALRRREHAGLRARIEQLTRDESEPALVRATATEVLAGLPPPRVR